MSNSNISRTGGKLFSETNKFVTSAPPAAQVSSSVSKILVKDSFDGRTLPSKAKKNVLSQMFDIAKNFVKECLFSKKQIRPRIEYKYPIVRQIAETKKVLSARSIELVEMKKIIERDQHRIELQKAHHAASEKRLIEQMNKLNQEIGSDEKLPGVNASPEEIKIFSNRANGLIRLNEKQRALNEEKAALAEDVKAFDNYIAKTFTPKMKEWTAKRKELARLEADLRDIEDQIEEQILLSQQ